MTESVIRVVREMPVTLSPASLTVLPPLEASAQYLLSTKVADIVAKLPRVTFDVKNKCPTLS